MSLRPRHSVILKRLGGTAIIIARIITIDGVITITIPVIITIIVITTTVIITTTIAGIIIVTGIIGIAVIGGDELTAANFRRSATVVSVTTVAVARFRRPIAFAARSDLTCRARVPPLCCRPTFSAHERLAMRRKFAVLALLLTVGAQLSGCDKCGGWEEIRSPIPVKTCAGDAAR